MEIKGKRISIEDLKVEDAFEMRDWGFHENSLLSDYNFPKMIDKEVERWYALKTCSFKDKYFSVRDENRKLIGYMGIKNIKLIRRESTLGIVFDPNKIDKGYGTETLLVFLNHYFTQMNMKKMYLEVAEFNTRAKRVYEKVGFVEDGYYLDLFHDKELDFFGIDYINNKSSFVIDGKKIYNYVYRMKLERESFLSKINQI